MSVTELLKCFCPKTLLELIDYSCYWRHPTTCVRSSAAQWLGGSFCSYCSSEVCLCGLQSLAAAAGLHSEICTHVGSPSSAELYLDILTQFELRNACASLFIINSLYLALLPTAFWSESSLSGSFRLLFSLARMLNTLNSFNLLLQGGRNWYTLRLRRMWRTVQRKGGGLKTRWFFCLIANTFKMVLFHQ